MSHWWNCPILKEPNANEKKQKILGYLGIVCTHVFCLLLDIVVVQYVISIRTISSNTVYNVKLSFWWPLCSKLQRFSHYISYTSCSFSSTDAAKHFCLFVLCLRSELGENFVLLFINVRFFVIISSFIMLSRDGSCLLFLPLAGFFVVKCCSPHKLS